MKYKPDWDIGEWWRESDLQCCLLEHKIAAWNSRHCLFGNKWFTILGI